MLKKCVFVVYKQPVRARGTRVAKIVVYFVLKYCENVVNLV